MSVTLALALCFRGIAVALLRMQLGQRWLRRPVTLLVLTAVTYSGLVEVLLLAPSIRVWDTNRLGIGQNYINSAALIMSAGLLALVCCYLMTRPERCAAEPRLAARVLDWRLFALFCLPLAALTYAGRGYDSVTSGNSATSVSLAGQFLTVLVVLGSFAFLLRHGMRWFVPVLAVQSAFLATVGERNPLVTDTIILLVLLACVSRRPSRRQVGATLALTAVVILAITGYRGVGETNRGLFAQQSGVAARAAAIGEGVETIFRTSSPGGTSPRLVAQAAARLDGDAFAGGVLQGLRSGDQILGLANVGKSLLVVVPSAVWSSKLSHSAGLNPVQAEIDEFGLHPVAGVAIAPLPTFLGLYLGFLPYGLIVFLGVTSLFFGWGERWLLRKFTVARLAALAAVAQAAFAYEAGLPTMLVGVRTALVLAVAVRLLQRMRSAPGTGAVPVLEPTMVWLPRRRLALAGHRMSAPRLRAPQAGRRSRRGLVLRASLVPRRRAAQHSRAHHRRGRSQARHARPAVVVPAPRSAGRPAHRRGARATRMPSGLQPPARFGHR